MSIRRPPELPIDISILNENPQLKEWVSETNAFLQEVWSTLKFFNIGDLAITAGVGAPTGGQDGDIYVRVAGVNTYLYQNLNGTWTINT